MSTQLSVVLTDDVALSRCRVVEERGTALLGAHTVARPSTHAGAKS
jgi:hypothetical protein